MPRNEIFAEDFVYDEFAYLDYTRSDNTNREERRKMKIILSKAVLEELTELQRICLTEYYLKGRKKKDIAKELSVHPSTVTRHIHRAEEKLRHIASYYQ